MDAIQATTNSLYSNSGTQATQGHHRHHQRKSITDEVANLSSAIDKATKSGILSSDLSASLKAELKDVTQILSQAKNNGSKGQGLSQLSSDDKQKVMKELSDVTRQLNQALNPPVVLSTTPPSGSQGATGTLFGGSTSGSGSTLNITA